MDNLQIRPMNPPSILTTTGGLSQSDAVARLRSDGPNELPTAKPRRLFATAWEILREPMLLLLVGAGAIYLFHGELRDSVVLLVSIFVVIGISLYQERKTERALEALRDLSSPRALVIRGGQRRRIAGPEVVRGDLVVLSEGDRVPADGVVLSAGNLSIDESLLTGESLPVRKAAWDGRAEMGHPGGDDLPFVYSGTLVVQGQGFAEIRATGARTELGRIGKALQTVSTEQTRLQAEVGRLAGILATLGLSLCFLIVVAYGLTRGSWIDG
jgi:Ca2+-transporting ATPase